MFFSLLVTERLRLLLGESRTNCRAVSKSTTTTATHVLAVPIAMLYFGAR
jgi:hypothetical protein